MLNSRAGAVRVVCATVAFGMGLDLPDIGLVVHWNAAHSFLDYVQQIGRAGRNGEPCLCITMYDRSECQRQERLARKATDPRRREFDVANMQKVRFPLQNLRESICMEGYTISCMQIHQWYEQTTECRHVHLERQFGDCTDMCGVNCGTRCDRCRQEQHIGAIVTHFYDEHA
jgi:superfamily II DNA helicase RecQ